MNFHKIRIGELAELDRHHPLIAAEHPGLADAVLPQTGDADPDFPILFYCEEDNDLACYIRSFPDRLRWNGEDIPWAWNANLMTLPAFRRRGLARAIVEDQLAEFGRMGLVWGGVFSAPAALHLYRKLSFSMVGQAPRLCALRNARAFLAHHMPQGPARLLGGLGAGAMAGIDTLLRLRQPWRGKVRLKDVPRAEFAALGDRAGAAADGRGHFDTDADWVLRRQAVRGVDRIVDVHIPGQEAPVGYILLRQRKNEKRPIREKYYGVEVMTLMHYGLFDSRPEGAEILLSGALNAFAAGRADLFEVVSSDPGMIAAARRAGLIPLGEGMSFKFMEPPDRKGRLPSDLAAYKLTHYSGDAFAFE